jgi:hypothetical protein
MFYLLPFTAYSITTASNENGGFVSSDVKETDALYPEPIICVSRILSTLPEPYVAVPYVAVGEPNLEKLLVLFANGITLG